MTYETYHPTLHAVVREICRAVASDGSIVNEPIMETGGVPYGETRQGNVDCEFGGIAHYAVYRMDSGTYELVLYWAVPPKVLV